MGRLPVTFVSSIHVFWDYTDPTTLKSLSIPFKYSGNKADQFAFGHRNLFFFSSFWSEAFQSHYLSAL